MLSLNFNYTVYSFSININCFSNCQDMTGGKRFCKVGDYFKIFYTYACLAKLREAIH